MASGQTGLRTGDCCWSLRWTSCTLEHALRLEHKWLYLSRISCVIEKTHDSSYEKRLAIYSFFVLCSFVWVNCFSFHQFGWIILFASAWNFACKCNYCWCARGICCWIDILESFHVDCFARLLLCCCSIVLCVCCLCAFRFQAFSTQCCNSNSSTTHTCIHLKFKRCPKYFNKNKRCVCIKSILVLTHLHLCFDHLHCFVWTYIF